MEVRDLAMVSFRAVGEGTRPGAILRVPRCFWLVVAAGLSLSAAPVTE